MRVLGVVVWLSFGMAKVLGSITMICSIGYFFYFVLFALFFPIIANISILLSHWHSHINFYSQFSQFMRRCKDCNACKNLRYLCIMLLRLITQNKTDRNTANLSVLLLSLEKVPGKGALFFSSVRQLGAAVAEWLSSWLAEQEDRGSIPGLATWIFRDWLSPASKSRYSWNTAKST